MALDLGVKFNQNPDEKAKVSANDRATGYLEDKFTSSDSSVTISVQDEGQQEKIDLTVAGGGGGGAALDATLAIGNLTNGNNICWTANDVMDTDTGLQQFRMDDGFGTTSWGASGLGQTSNGRITLNTTEIDLNCFNGTNTGGRILLNPGTAGISIQHNQSGFDSIISMGGSGIRLDTAALNFYTGALPVAQQTITGSRGGNAALADFLTKLELTGLIIDNTTS